MNEVKKNQNNGFIISECMMSSVQSGLQTRNKNFPIYNDQKKSQPDKISGLKDFIFDFLGEYLNEIKENGIIESVHQTKIMELADKVTNQFWPILHEGRFRIGISQKIINLFLKYMWSMNEIPEPCHCPIDGIVKSQLKNKTIDFLLVDWTRLDQMDDYQSYVKAVKQVADEKNLSIAQWEYDHWKRR
ncbi:MAG TPA: hypothetical protein VFG54_20780 [Prolixibacteraceae bacterium]|nr:hypothetical protein [Prolixibacteraceae bacterium]